MTVSANTGAPGELEHVRAFVNTIDVESRKDGLSTPAELARWLAGRGLLDPHARATRNDLAAAVSVREALRALLVANNGGAPDPSAAGVLDAAAGAARLAVRFGDDGRAVLRPAARGVPAAIGRLLAIAAAAMADGTWDRLKACRSDTCRWAYYDRAKNRSRTWCSMKVCGNRTKVKAFRRRARE